MKNKYFFIFALLLLSSVSFISAEWNSTLNEGLEVYYNFEGVVDSNIIDQFSGVYNATIQNGATTSSGKVGDSLNFVSSSSQYASTNYYFPQGDKTMSVWFNSSSSSGYLWVLGGGGYSGGFGLVVNYGSEGDTYVWLQGSDYGCSGYSTNEWHNAVVTMSGGSLSQLYLDGVNCANATGSFTTSLDNPLMLGAYFGGSNFDGQIDEFASWNRSLTSDEVTQLYNGGNGITYAPSVTPLKTNIETCQDLQNIENYLDEDYVLANDIDCAGFDFTPISLFTGSLDGQGYAINNLTINPEFGGDVQGLTAYSNGAYFNNFSMNNVYVRGGIYVGSIGGDVKNSIIENVHAQGVVDGNSETGGLVGVVYTNVSIKHSSYSGEVLGYYGNDIAGLVGYMGGYPDYSSIEDSYAETSIVGSTVGGLIGLQDSNVEIIRSYYNGDITCSGNCGGLVSEFYGIIESSYSKGTLNGGASGGLIASGGGSITQNYGIINNSYTFMNITASPVGGIFYNYDFNSQQGQITNTYVGGYVYGGGDADSGSYGAYPVGENNYTSNYYIEDRSDVERTFSSYFSQSAPYPTNLTVEQMMIQSSFPEFDFNNVWTICTKENSSYPFPYLKWQNDVICEDIQQEVTPPQFTGTGLAIYNVMEGSGAGLGIFIQNLSRGLPLLLIGLAFVTIIIVIFKPMGKLIESSSEIFKTFGR